MYAAKENMNYLRKDLIPALYVRQEATGKRPNHLSFSWRTSQPIAVQDASPRRPMGTLDQKRLSFMS